MRDLLKMEWDEGAADEGFPMAPARIVHDIREAMGREDVVLCDTGAAKMWMARLYPTYEPNTCLLSNGLATMAFALPGAIAAKLVYPERRGAGRDGGRRLPDERGGARDGRARGRLARRS